MIDALKRARELISTLRAESFIQKASTNILTQLSSHVSSSMSNLANHENKSLYSVLMQMAKDVAVQADQTLVQNLIDIIDDLLRHEQDGLTSESATE